MSIRYCVLIPCYNEDKTIAKVIHDVKTSVPSAEIIVFDNNSTDNTIDCAQQAGARIIKEKRQGKGFVVQAMFAKADADIYIMVDGDDTYDLQRLPEMVALVESDQVDMVVGSRLCTYEKKSFRPLHTFGNRLVTVLINRLFGGNLSDVMSGFRIMNRDFVKNINITSQGFEVETEMSIKALKLAAVIRETSIVYRERPEGSFSKLNTFKDGVLVLKTIFMIGKDYKPFLFFAVLSLLLLAVSLATGTVVISEFIATRYISHVPLAILASGSMILSMVFFVAGLILDCINRRFDELHHFIRQK